MADQFPRKPPRHFTSVAAGASRSHDSKTRAFQLLARTVAVKPNGPVRVGRQLLRIALCPTAHVIRPHFAKGRPHPLQRHVAAPVLQLFPQSPVAERLHLLPALQQPLHFPFQPRLQFAE